MLRMVAKKYMVPAITAALLLAVHWSIGHAVAIFRELPSSLQR